MRLTIRKLSSLCVLGIESSCDDTAIGVVKLCQERAAILSHHISSQFKSNLAHGGVVPNLAAREHEVNMKYILDRITCDMNGHGGIQSIDAVAVAAGPGLAPCLKVGMNTAKSLCQTYNKPLILVNHLEAHAFIARMEQSDTVQYPFLTLIASGGHTMLVLVLEYGRCCRLGSTLDDSIGEAFDKVSRMLDLHSPINVGKHGGALVESMALRGDRGRYPLTLPMRGRKDCNFSFSGLKSNVRRLTQEVLSSPMSDSERDKIVCDMAASFQYTAVEHILDKTRKAINKSNDMCKEEGKKLSSLVVSGGVAANTYLRDRMLSLGEEIGGLPVVFPSIEYCTDNGVMIAWTGIERARLGLYSDINTADFKPRWPLGQPIPGAVDKGDSKVVKAEGKKQFRFIKSDIKFEEDAV